MPSKIIKLSGPSSLELAWRSFRKEMDIELGIVEPDPEEPPAPVLFHKRAFQKRNDRTGRFSKPTPTRINPNMVMLPGEITFKQWLQDEADRTHTSPKTVYNRYYQGKYPKLKIRQPNSRIIFVQSGQ